VKYQFEKDQKTSKVHSKEVPMNNMNAQQGSANKQQERTTRRCKAHIRMHSKEVPTSNRNTQQGGTNKQQECTTRRCKAHIKNA
jgi:hypothetical protein